MRVYKATGSCYRINIVCVCGGGGVYILSGVTEKRRESKINPIVWVFQLLLAGIIVLVVGVIFDSMNSLFSSKGQSVGLTSATVFTLLAFPRVFAGVDSSIFKVSSYRP